MVSSSPHIELCAAHDRRTYRPGTFDVMPTNWGGYVPRNYKNMGRVRPTLVQRSYKKMGRVRLPTRKSAGYVRQCSENAKLACEISTRCSTYTTDSVRSVRYGHRSCKKHAHPVLFVYRLPRPTWHAWRLTIFLQRDHSSSIQFAPPLYGSHCTAAVAAPPSSAGSANSHPLTRLGWLGSGR